MVNINPITENFEEMINNSDNQSMQNDQDNNQLSENKTINNSPTTLSQPPEVNNHPIYNVTDKEILEAKKEKNELLAINVFAIFGVIICALLIILKISYSTDASGNSNIFFMNIIDLSLFLLILKKSDLARKVIIKLEVIIILFSLLLAFMRGMSSEFSITSLVDLIPSILFAALVISFLNSARIKRHFA